MARDFEASSSQYLGASSDVTGASAAWSFACWAKLETASVSQCIMSLATSGSANHYFRLDVSATNVIRFRARDTGNSDALSSGTVTSGAWYHIGCKVTSTTSRHVFLDGAKTSNTTSRSPSGYNRTGVGRSSESSGTAYFDGIIALPTFWTTDLSDADFASLAAGAWPGSIESGSIVGPYQLSGASPEVPDTGSGDLVVTGAIYTTDEPPLVTFPGGTVFQYLGLLGVGS